MTATFSAVGTSIYSSDDTVNDPSLKVRGQACLKRPHGPRLSPGESLHRARIDRLSVIDSESANSPDDPRPFRSIKTALTGERKLVIEFL